MTKMTKRGVTPGNNVRQVVNSVLAQRAEEKYAVHTLTASTLSTSGLVTAVSQDIIQGSNVNERAGNAINLQKIALRFTSSGGGVSSYVRFMLVSDRFNNGTLPSVTDILNAVTPTAPLNINTYTDKRFSILVDELMPSVATTETALLVKVVQKAVRKRIGYNGSTSVAAANGPNSLFTVMLSSTNITPPVVTYTVGLHYTDF